MPRVCQLSSVAGLALLVAGCATSTLYQPAPEPEAYGYRDFSLTSERYRVSFTGNHLTSRETVETYALYRAAEVALAAGYEHFRLISRDTEATTSYQGFSTGVGTVGFGYGYWGGPYFGSGIGISNAEPSTRYRTVAEIQVGPEVGDDGPDIYDARELKAKLEERVNRPEG